VNDVIRRLLELEFGAEKVRHVRNVTDVDDKTIRRAREEGRSLREITRELTEKFHADCDALNCLRPHEEPTATDHIAEQIAMIARLVEQGHAYATGAGSVYFKVDSFPSYGRVSRLTERQPHAGAESSSPGSSRPSNRESVGEPLELRRCPKSPLRYSDPGSILARPNTGWQAPCPGRRVGRSLSPAHL